MTIDPVLKETSSKETSQDELINNYGNVFFKSKFKLDLSVLIGLCFKEAD